MQEKEKITYTKPEVLDLGPAATIHGALCSAGSLAIGNCQAGASATTTCSGGNSAGGNCLLPGNNNKTLILGPM